MALDAARNQSSDYLILLKILQWKRHSLLNMGHKVKMNVKAYDVSTGRMLADDAIEAVCYVMVVGLEQSPRECVRPQIEIWMNRTFHTDAVLEVNTVPIPPPRIP